jgi:hypothetical protein
MSPVGTPKAQTGIKKQASQILKPLVCPAKDTSKVKHQAEQISRCRNDLDLEINASKTPEILAGNENPEGHEQDRAVDVPQSTDNLRFSSKENLLILSCNNKNKIAHIIRDNDIFQNFSYCHHIMPGAGVRDLLKGLKTRLQNMTMNDYCVIIIGEEEDFGGPTDVNALVHHIREVVNSIDFTNIILSCPTFICGRPLYNERVESFNYALFNDLCNHNKCFFVYDSNANLELNMFSARSGRLNNRGMKNIIENLQYNISWSSRNSVYDGSNNSHHSNDFFRAQV